jgi:hypothetical protein
VGGHVHMRWRIRWRGAIGWIAAYALALQTIAGGLDLASSAAAAAATVSFDAAVICHGHDGDNAAAEIPGKTGTAPCNHCGFCLGASAVLAPPSPVQSVAALLGARDIAWPAAGRETLPAVRHPS